MIYQDVADNFNRLMAGLVFVLHSALLIYYLVIKSGSNSWYFWLIFDVIILGVMIYAFIVTYVRKRSRAITGGIINRLLDYNYPGQLPFAVWIWLGICVSSSIRIGIILRTYSSSITETVVAGPSLLLLTIGLLSPVLFFVVRATRLVTDRPSYIYEEGVFLATESLNIFDSTDLLRHVFDTSVTSDAVNTAIVVLALLTFFVPLVNLAKYTLQPYNRSMEHSRLDASIGLNVLYCLSSILLSNIAVLILRFIVWRTFSVPVSGAFIVKDILFTYVFAVSLGKQFTLKSSTYEKHRISQ